jgi:hypothetical protein
MADMGIDRLIRQNILGADSAVFENPRIELYLDLAELTVEFVATDPVLGLILHREVPRLGSNAQDRIRMAHTDLSASLVGLYLDAVKAGTYRPIAPDLAGRLIHDVTMSAARSVIAAPERLREVTENLRLFLHQGFASRSR